MTDQASNVRTAEYDALNRIQRVVEAGTYTTDHTYDLRGSLLSVKQGSGTSTTLSRSFVYDSLGRLSSATNPESGTINYVYDPNGNLTSKTDANNTVTTITYDELNRVLLKSYTAGTGVAATTPVNYCYDNESGTVTTNGVTRNCNGVLSSTFPIGRLTQVLNGNVIRRFAYNDPLGRITSLQQVPKPAKQSLPLQLYLFPLRRNQHLHFSLRPCAAISLRRRQPAHHARCQSDDELLPLRRSDGYRRLRSSGRHREHESGGGESGGSAAL